ncbi:MAG TPA: iron ABC transporter permease [Bryobacteraceae bacterium]|nr:iron ABC transporter permease [Bryobacteraceae bacterium]
MNSTISANWTDQLRATPRWPYFALAAAMLVLLLLELAVGAVSIPFFDVVRILFTGESERSTWLQIVQQFRLIRTLNALFSGAAIAVCGLLLQTLFRNPLADPYVLGVMDGARLGVAVVVVISGAASNTFFAKFAFLGDLSQVAAAALGSVLSMAVLLWIAHRVSTVTLLISGLMLGYLCQGLISVVLHFTDEYQAAAFSAWNDGSYAGITRGQLSLLIPLTVLGLASALLLVKPLNALLMGERYAQTLGLPVFRARMVTFGIVAALGGTVTAFCGPIAFLGIIVAHLARAIFQTSDHRVLMPAVILLGSVLALGADLITHLPWAKHFLHMNAVNGLIGAPIVLWVLLRQKHMRGLAQ